MIGIYLILKELRGKFSIGTLEERIFVQKAIYLLQILGGEETDLKFRYGWYHYGPYCTSLSDLVFELAKNIEKDKDLEAKIKKLKLNDAYKGSVEKLKSLIEQKPSNLNDTKWVELLCSVHFIKEIAFTRKEVKKSNVKDWLDEFHKDFKKVDADKAWDTLKRYELLN